MSLRLISRKLVLQTVKNTTHTLQRSPLPKRVQSSLLQFNTTIIRPQHSLLRRSFLSQVTPLRHVSTKSNDGSPSSHQKDKTTISKYQHFIASTSTSFLDTIKLSLKWLLIKQNRPFNADDMSAFISWFVWSNILWFILGTTTFVSIVLYAMKSIGKNNNSDNQGNSDSFLDRFILKLLFKYDPEKISISFVNDNKSPSVSSDNNVEQLENIKPSLRDGVITLNNLRIHSKDTAVNDNTNANNNDTSEVSNNTKNDDNVDNSVKFDILISRVDLTLDFSKWYHGKGLVNTLYIDGVQGVIENNLTDSEIFEIEDSSEDTNTNLADSVSQKSAITELVRLFNNNSEYEFGKIKIRNMNMIYSSVNNGYEQIDLQIFNWDLKKLRMKWVLFDLLKTKICSGTIGNALFTIHQKQLHTQSNILIQKFTDFNNSNNNIIENDDDDDDEPNMNSITRIQVSSINLKSNPLLKKNFNWLVDGKANLICDINIPSEKHFQLADLLKELASNLIDANVDINVENLISSAKSFINNSDHQLSSRSSSFNECFALFDIVDLNNIDSSMNLLKDSAMINTNNDDDENYGKNYIFRMVPDQDNSSTNKLVKLSSIPTSSPINGQSFNGGRNMKKNKNNRYIIVDLKIQFVNSIAKMPASLPFCKSKETSYIGYDELKRIVSLINGNSDYGYHYQHSSFFSRRNRSILSNVNSKRKYYHYSSNNKNLCVISNDDREGDLDSIYGNSEHEAGSDNDELIDRQFTLRSSSIFRLDDLYKKVSITSETNMLDQCVSDLYDDLIKNLHHEMQTRFRFR